MKEIVEILRSDIALIVMASVLVLMIILYIYNCVKLRKIQKNYKKFLDKIGSNSNIEEDLKQYVEKVDAVEKENNKLSEHLKNTDKNVRDCIQKVGIVRYSAFENIGSDLSFTLALLDEDNNGVVLNGIYSGDMSNIYAKPVENGKSTYTLSEQEKEAIKKAVDNVVSV